ncbi:MAG: hypothetical protein EOM23_04150 [Candidatus Moranbacteria bacterium]|nr:hypothetical protein [Candidatus Moranbacteria bacterium]
MDIKEIKKTLIKYGLLNDFYKSLIEQYEKSGLSDKQMIYFQRIIDTYSSLMPAFVGEEISGLKIQEAVLNAGVKITGATVYFVTEKPNSGPIILQKAVAVRESDTPAVLQRRILEEAENIILPRAVSLYCNGKLSISNGVVHIAEPEERTSDKMTK